MDPGGRAVPQAGRGLACRRADACGSLRFSFGHDSVPQDTDAVGAVIREVVERARRATAR